MKKIVSFIRVMMVFAVMVCIFYLSSQTATTSRALSNKVVAHLEEYIEATAWLMPTIREIYLKQPTIWTRKLAHFMIYMVLGLVSYLALPKKWPTKKKIGIVISLCFFYAITDEFHQSFVPGRGPQMRDVWIDTIGSSVGMSMGYLIKNNNKIKKHYGD